MEDFVSQREVLLAAGLHRFAAQLAKMAKDIDELQEIARDRPTMVVITGDRVVKLERVDR
jgi:hypothetical protein